VVACVALATSACGSREAHVTPAAEAPAPKPAEQVTAAPPVAAPAPSQPPTPPNAAKGALQVQFIAETAPYPAELGTGAPAVALADSERFHGAWAAARVAIESQVTVHNLVEISRWAKRETMGATLPRGWPERLPMSPIGATADGRTVLFGQSEAAQSPVELPSHTSVVHRRLLAAAAYDRQAGAITAVYVTIRGWAEE